VLGTQSQSDNELMLSSPQKSRESRSDELIAG